ncbi:hypothetical protein [Streptomyces sp. NPDC001635]
MALGAPPPRASCDPAVWLRDALVAVGARNIRHRGAHRFVFRLGRTRQEREEIELGLTALRPYPKQPDPEPAPAWPALRAPPAAAGVQSYLPSSRLLGAAMPSRTALPSTAPDLTSYDLLAPQLSGGKDSAVMMAVFMEAARASGVDDRVISYHSSLGVLEWPPVVFAGIRYPGVSELAALQSAAFGVPADRHMEVTRTMPGPDGTRMPHSLLTEIAAYGRFPRMGSPYCRKSAKESVVSSAWTPIVDRLKRELGHPVRILKVMGLRSDEGPDRVKRAAFRTVQANSARIVDEWLPVKDWSTHAVKEWHADAPVRYRWTYDWCPAPATGPAPHESLTGLRHDGPQRIPRLA